MFKNVVGLVIADDRRLQLGDLTKPRALSAVPFGGRYRIIDFALSNMVNSGIKTIGVSTFNKYKSLMDHIGSGSAWDLDRKTQGLYFLTPHVLSESYNMSSADDMSGLISFYRDLRQKYIIIAQSDAVMTTTFNEMLEYHIAKNADITVMYNKDSEKANASSYILDMTRTGKVKTVYENPLNPVSNRKTLGVMIMEKELFVNVLADGVSQGVKIWDFGFFLKHCDRLNIFGYEYKGLALRITSIPEYFDATMQLLDAEARRALFWSERPVFTKVKDEAPTQYSASCIVKNSVISDGCMIQGSVEDSVVFRGVTVSGQSKLKNCIVLQDSFISESCELENVIIDKDCLIRPGIKLIGQKEYPVVIGKGSVV